MKKENIKYTAILITFAISVVFFASCAKKIDESGKETEVYTAASTTESTTYIPSEFKTEEEKIFEQDGKLYYRENSGEEAHELVTDENGVTVADENGNLIWKVTDAQGNEATEAVPFPDFINNGNIISCQQFSITCPDGWESKSNVNLIIKNADENKSINYSFTDKTDETYMSIDKNIEEIEKMFKSLIDDGSVVITTSTTQIAGRDAAKLIMEMTGDTPSYMELYYIETENGTMLFNCSCNYEDKGFDFKAILDTIEYRIK